MFTKRLPALALAFLVFFLGGGVVVAEEANSKTDSIAQTCREGAYVMNLTNEAKERWKKLRHALPKRLVVRTDYTFEANGKLEKGVDTRSGSAGVLADSYVITVNHVAGNPEKYIADFLLKSGVRGYANFKVVNTWYRIEFDNFAMEGDNILSLLWFDEKRDIALLKLNYKIPLEYSLPVLIGDSKKLDVFSLLAMSGNLFDFGPHPRLGYVSEVNAPQYKGSGVDIPEGFYFTAVLPVIYGDSGGFVFALTPCGDFEWVGVMVTIIPGGMFIPVRQILRADEMVKAFSPKVDLDKAQKEFLLGQKKN